MHTQELLLPHRTELLLPGRPWQLQVEPLPKRQKELLAWQTPSACPWAMQVAPLEHEHCA